MGSPHRRKIATPEFNEKAQGPTSLRLSLLLSLPRIFENAKKSQNYTG
jgi:hypothetical protein